MAYLFCGFCEIVFIPNITVCHWLKTVSFFLGINLRVEADPVGETLYSARNIDGGRSLETKLLLSVKYLHANSLKQPYPSSTGSIALLVIYIASR